MVRGTSRRAQARSLHPSSLTRLLLSSLPPFLSNPVINYFETQLHVPSSQPANLPPTVVSNAVRKNGHPVERQSSQPSGGFRNAYEEEVVILEANVAADGKMQTAVTVADQMMTDEERIAWFAKILDAVRMRYRKLQRFARWVFPLLHHPDLSFLRPL